MDSKEELSYPVFVYGTLKRKGSNHRLLLRDQAEFLGSGKTDDTYPLKIGQYPFLLDEKGKGKIVEGELYLIKNTRVLKRLDELEDHPKMYERRLRPISSKTYRGLAWVYFYKLDSNHLSKLPDESSFDVAKIDYC